MPIHAVIEIKSNGKNITGRDADRPEHVPIRAWRTIMKHGYAAAGEHWHRTYLPLHFTKAAYYRYPQVYQRRSLGYFLRHHVDQGSRKERLAAARVAAVDPQPNVFTGRLRELSRIMALRAFQTRVTVTVQVPSYVKTVRKGSSRADTVRELTYVNSQETESLARVVERDVNRNLQHFVKTKQLPTSGV